MNNGVHGPSRVITETTIQAWGVADGGSSTTDKISGENFQSIVRNGTGDYTITLATEAPDSDYGVIATAKHDVSRTMVVTNSTRNTFDILAFDSSGVAADVTQLSFILVHP